MFTSKNQFNQPLYILASTSLLVFFVSAASTDGRTVVVHLELHGEGGGGGSVRSRQRLAGRQRLATGVPQNVPARVCEEGRAQQQVMLCSLSLVLQLIHLVWCQCLCAIAFSLVIDSIVSTDK